MTYKSTTFKTKINVDSTHMKYLNLQPTFLAPPIQLKPSWTVQGST